MAARKPKRGRPALPKGVGKSEMLRVKATPSEVALLDGVAARHGVGRSEVIRRAIYVVAMQPDLVKPVFVSREVRAKVIQTVLDSGLRFDVRRPKPGVEPVWYWESPGQGKLDMDRLQQLRQEWADRNGMTVADGERAFNAFGRLNEWSNADALRQALEDQQESMDE